VFIHGAHISIAFGILIAALGPIRNRIEQFAQILTTGIVVGQRVTISAAQIIPHVPQAPNRFVFVDLAGHAAALRLA
jgi:hypothetical protein